MSSVCASELLRQNSYLQCDIKEMGVTSWFHQLGWSFRYGQVHFFLQQNRRQLSLYCEDSDPYWPVGSYVPE